MTPLLQTIIPLAGFCVSILIIFQLDRNNRKREKILEHYRDLAKNRMAILNHAQVIIEALSLRLMHGQPRCYVCGKLIKKGNVFYHKPNNVIPFISRCKCHGSVTITHMDRLPKLIISLEDEIHQTSRIR